MAYTVTAYRFQSREFSELKPAMIQARINARENNWVCFIDITEAKTLNQKEREIKKQTNDEYAIVGQIKVMPNGSHKEL